MFRNKDQEHWLSVLSFASRPFTLKAKVKVKLSLCLTKHHAMKAYWGSSVCLHAFLTSALDGTTIHIIVVYLQYHVFLQSFLLILLIHRLVPILPFSSSLLIIDCQRTKQLWNDKDSCDRRTLEVVVLLSWSDDNTNLHHSTGAHLFILWRYANRSA